MTSICNQRLYALDRSFGKSHLTHLTTKLMFSGLRFAILAIFLLRGCIILCVERLLDFVCGEVS